MEVYVMNQSAQYALITGASRGIGFELAKQFANEGKNLIIVARDKDKLEQVRTEIEATYKTKVLAMSKDLSDPRAPLEIFSQVKNEGAGVDVLVNNAGFGIVGNFLKTDLQQELAMIQVFTSTLASMTKLFLKDMVERKSGRIVNVASGLALVPVPLFSIYSACEAFILHFSEALANELKGSGVKVTCLCCSPTKTSFFERANVGNTRYAHSKMMVDAATTARLGYRAIRNNRETAMLGLANKSLVIMSRLLPRKTATNLIRSYVEWGLQEAKSQ